MTLIVGLAKLLLKVIYGIMKLFPCGKRKILFLSRQSDDLTLDFAMLKDRLEELDSGIEIIQICNRLDDGKKGLIGFGVDTLKSMYHLATSRVCVLDAYWPAVSILHHKSSLTVIQMWHALGKIKKSGYQTIGKPSGRSYKVAKLLNMHENYDYIVAGGKAWNKYYCQSFNTTEDKLLNVGLPRIDYLISSESSNRDRVLERYPEFKEKKIVLYAPTFRRGIELKWKPLLDSVDFESSVLIIKGHPNQEITCRHEGVYLCPEFKAVELLAICDYLITDYSAIAVEGAILNRPTLYYLYDFDEYTEKNGINVSPFESMEGCAFTDAEPLMAIINNDTYDYVALKNYREKYLPENLGQSTEKLADFIMGKLQ